MTAARTFSISVPVRSGVEWLPLALDSIACQTGPVRVALLDASGDQRVRQLADQHRERIGYTYHRPADGGQAAAIAEGWERVPGEYLAWLNADDQLLPGALEKVRATFAANPQVDVVYGHAAYLAADGSFQTYFPAISADAQALPRGNVICQPACFFRRSAVARVGGLDTHRHFTMDWDLWLRLLDARCRFLFLNEPLAAVRNHPATKTNSGDPRRQGEIRDLLDRRQRGRIRRAATLVGVAIGDMHTGGHVASSPLLGSVVGLGRRLHRWLHPSAELLGLERVGNGVRGTCRVVMPNTHRGSGRLVLYAARPARFSVRWRGEWMDLQGGGGRRTVEAFGGRRLAYGHEAPLMSDCPPLIDAEFHCHDGAWRLLAVAVKPE